MTQSPDREHIIVIGASAGGLKPMTEILDMLRPGIDAPVVVAVHSGEHSKLAQVLARSSALPVQAVSDRATLHPGTVYVCPGGKQSRIDGRNLQISETQPGMLYQPSVDVLFETAAAQYGAGIIAVVLSGVMKDGTRGARAVFDAGGVMLVQSPAEAQFSAMPQSIITNDHPNAVLLAEDIAQRLYEIAGERGLLRRSGQRA